MTYLLPTFQTVSLIFALSAIITGAQAIINPINFSRSFGIPLLAADQSKSQPQYNSNPLTTYVSLMGIRQLATGLTLLTFAYQGKWTEMATILSILGTVVAGTDGIYLSRSGARNQAMFHAIPGALIALLATATVLTDA